MEKGRQRPAMIGVLGSLNVLGGSVLMLVAFGAPRGAEGAGLFGLGLLGLVIGIGLLRLRPWARIVAIGGYCVNLITGVAAVNVPVMLISSLIIAYLFSGRVKEAFATQPLAAPQVIESLPEEGHAA